jgi:hypothetical protein
LVARLEYDPTREAEQRELGVDIGAGAQERAQAQLVSEIEERCEVVLRVLLAGSSWMPHGTYVSTIESPRPRTDSNARRQWVRSIRK